MKEGKRPGMMNDVFEITRQNKTEAEEQTEMNNTLHLDSGSHGHRQHSGRDFIPSLRVHESFQVAAGLTCKMWNIESIEGATRSGILLDHRWHLASGIAEEQD
ncbi:hypothetical protein GLAREA_07156 [Glarea lozoyensis ATCC 20868]|uniref:Uncharacterized protein n=1 Tax=Glarea lozoyensis (strain ATCC 20868 / MF5171) TaxID=1116229 RepID=S3E714_GLAL2|nr:uncharacterized protein GLAREA_07156 [Glarea lozoyensis ATCC 20868]EPE34143.1 hypothetical protein GLAREA_07156 [Glarea lozoyensis ATCC 20868]